jgi:hypothetical protein
MSKREIDAMVAKYQKGELSPQQIKKVAQAIITNKRCRELALRGAVSSWNLPLAYKIINHATV